MSSIRDWLLRVWRGGTPPPAEDGSPPTTLGPGRVAGAPPSGNGASSFHLFWDLPGTFSAVRATIKVVQPPTANRLYFWALQADFTDESGQSHGGAHLGPQFHPDYPGRTAVNWGGYESDGRILRGSTSPLRGSLGNPHTRDFPWKPGRTYRLAIELADDQTDAMPGTTAWEGSIADLSAGNRVVIRQLYPRGNRLVRPMVWAEVFARCDDPTVEVHWSDFEAVEFSTSEIVRANTVTLNYQSHNDGGCANTDSSPLPDSGIRQRTNVLRTQPQGSRINFS